MRAEVVAITGIYFFFLSFSPCSGRAGESEQNSSRTKLTSLHKSLLVPGWGQFAEKRYVEGIVLLSAEIFAVCSAFSHNSKGNRYYGQYKDAGNVDDAVMFRKLTEEHDTKRNQYLLVAAGIWAVNLIDIYFIVRGKKKKAGNPRLRVESGKKKLAFTLSYRF